MILNPRAVGPRLASAALVAGLALVGTTGAASAGTLTPVHVTDHAEFDDFLADCGDYELWDRGVFDQVGTEFYDSSGVLVRKVTRVSGSDTFYNATSGESVTGTIAAGEVLDFADGSVTESGTVGRITYPGLGVVFFDVGKFVIDFDEGLVFLAGHLHAFFTEDYDALCDLLR